jgi:hypothetical protein
MVYFRYIIVNSPHKGDNKGNNNNNNNNNKGHFILLSAHEATYRLTPGKYAYTPNFIKKSKHYKPQKGLGFIQSLSLVDAGCLCQILASS